VTSDFDSFLSSGFAEAAAILGTSTLTAKNGETASVIAEVPQLTRELRNAGLTEINARSVTLSRADFDLLALADRQPVTLGSTAYRVMLIEDDGAAEIVTVHLQLNR